MGGSVRRRSIIFAILAAAVSTTLATLIVLSGMNAYPDGDQRALKLMADPKHVALGEAEAVENLKGMPLNAPLLSALALAKEKEGQRETAARLMSAAGRLSWREPVTDAWLFQHFVQSGDFSNAMYRADALMRVRPELAPNFYGPLAALAADPRGADAIVQRLKYRPAWREPYLAKLSETAPLDVSLDVLSLLKSTNAPPTVNEAQGYVTRLMADKQYDRGLLATFLFLPGDRLNAMKNVFNGDFDDLTGIAPFDWHINYIAGLTVAFEGRPEQPGNRALHVFFDGFIFVQIVYQTIELPPGAYRFSVNSWVTPPESAKGLQWVVRCVNDGPTLMKFSPGENAREKHYAESFTVPADCGAQVLELTTVPADRQTQIDAWYDSVAIDRMEEQ